MRTYRLGHGQQRRRRHARVGIRAVLVAAIAVVGLATAASASATEQSSAGRLARASSAGAAHTITYDHYSLKIDAAGSMSGQASFTTGGCRARACGAMCCRR